MYLLMKEIAALELWNKFIATSTKFKIIDSPASALEKAFVSKDMNDV